VVVLPPVLVPVVHADVAHLAGVLADLAAAVRAEWQRAGRLRRDRRGTPRRRGGHRRPHRRRPGRPSAGDRRPHPDPGRINPVQAGNLDTVLPVDPATIQDTLILESPDAAVVLLASAP
jgi:hypothetical protein